MGKCKDCVAGVLGACKDYCAFERQLLEDQAQALAEAQGHLPGPWIKVENVAHWQSQCSHCGQALLISLTPKLGEAEISGPGLNSPCIPSSS